MKQSSPVCRECRCTGYTQTTRQHNRLVTARETSFECGARQTEVSDHGSQVGRIEFVGCGCGH